ncbi:DUF3592 domain-containing protein [Streptomyces sp. NPDC049555]|uniref:DUF3592 domain-containing protein n=1 Tax=Streptomyces sp. NPDC049555 TaxID=3154930 RepID=UPI003435B44A
MIEYILPAVPACMTVGALAAAAGVIVRRRRLNAAWYKGVTVEGRCLRTFLTTTTWQRGTHRSTSRTISHAYEFTTPEGRTLRFEENGPSTVFEGDVVAVRYPPGRPDLATARPPGDRGVKAAFRRQLAFLTFATLLCVAVTAVFSMVGSMLTDIGDSPGLPSSPGFPSSPSAPAPLPAAPSPPALPPLPTGPPDGFPTPPSGWPTGMPQMPEPPGSR